MPDAASGRFVFRLAPPLCDGPCRVGHQGGHRWLGGLPRAGQAGLCTRTAQPACRSARGEDGRLLPAVHRVASLAKRWLLGTHQGSADRAHVAACLNEFVFRFNRRGSRSRGMLFYRLLELAVAHAPVRYGQLVVPSVRAQCPKHRRRPVDTLRALTVPQRNAHGEPQGQVSPLRWIPPNALITSLIAVG
jgi:hypothetical protein